MVHVVPLIVISIFTISNLRYASTLTYILFSLAFIINLSTAVSIIVKKSIGFFYYAFSILLTLGFFVKFSVHQILNYDYVEPIGSFVFNAENINEILIISTVGVVGVLLAQLASGYLFPKLEQKRTDSEVGGKQNNLSMIIIFVVTVSMAYLNIKLNILMFGLKASVNLPFSGNAIYFLFLTRGIMFMMFYYCFRVVNKTTIIFGALIAMICSVAVMSRMIIILYFFSVLIFFLIKYKDFDFKEVIKSVAFISLLFAIFSYITVRASTHLRDKLYTLNSQASRTVANINGVYKSEDERFMIAYRNLVVDRWIGLEGVMAVQSYNDKGWSLFLEALKEKSYKGRSFYTKIASPQAYRDYNETNKTITTSVPGPIAFSYYLGNPVFILIFMFGTTFLFNSLVQCLRHKLELNIFTSIYISIFMVFDFFQFGISPIAFIKNWSFTFFCILIFLNRKSILLFFKQIPIKVER